MKRILAFTALFFAAYMVAAQTTTTTSTAIFTATSAPVYVALGGVPNAGDETAETLNVTSRAGVFGEQLLAPTINFQGYYAGVSYVPDLSKLWAKTLIPANEFNLSFRGGFGIDRNSAIAPVANHLSGFADTCAAYNPGGGAAVIPLCFGYLRAPGFSPTGNGWKASLGFGWVWGK